MDVHYKKPARLGDTIEITTEVTEITNATISLTHRVMKDEIFLVESHVKLACIDKDGKPKRLPADLKKSVTREK